MELQNINLVKIINGDSGTLVCTVEPHPLCLGEPVIRLMRYEAGHENQAPSIICIPVAESFHDTAAKLYSVADEFLWLISGLNSEEIYDLLDSDEARNFGFSELSRSFYLPFSGRG